MNANTIDIAIITILPEEYSAVLQEIGESKLYQSEDGSPNLYAWRLGNIPNSQGGGEYKVVVGMAGRPGNNSGTLTIKNTIDRWNPRYVLLVGIAGGLPLENLSKGDVVVSSAIWGYEYGKAAEVFHPRQDFTYQIDGSLYRNAIAFASNSKWYEGLENNPEGGQEVKAIPGPVASGDKVVDQITDEFFGQVQKAWPKLLAIEMEGAGAAAAIESARDEGKTVGFLMMRGISDMPNNLLGSSESSEINSETRGKWKNYASMTAARFTVRYIAESWPVPPLRVGISNSTSLEKNQTEVKTNNPADNINNKLILNYDDYLRNFLSVLDCQLNYSLPRTVSEFSGMPALSFPITLSGRSGDNILKSSSIIDLNNIYKSIVVLAEPGGGKTYLLQMAAWETLQAKDSGVIIRIPILLSAKRWGRTFNTIISGIRRELEPFIPDINDQIIQEELKVGKFLLLVDGIDEITQDVDIFYDELLRLAKTTKTSVVTTCRTDNYYHGLKEQFISFKIDPLTEEQIKEYALQVLGKRGNHFLYTIGSTLASLVRNPLFLLMTTAILKNSPQTTIPDNRASLYANFTSYLLTHWQREKESQQPIVVNQITKEMVLGKYAEKIFRGIPDEITFNEIIENYSKEHESRIIRGEIFRSGIIRVQPEGPEFYHPSFQEYYFAFNLSQKPDDEILNFIVTYHFDDRYLEVFIFLIGLLRDAQRQSLLLDYLESHNLYLFNRCLKARFNQAEQIQKDLPQNFAQDYFDQIRKTYLRIINEHFNLIMDLFEPWLGNADLALIKDYELAIKGSLEIAKLLVSYELDLVRADLLSTDHVTIVPFSRPPIIGIPTAEGTRGFTPTTLTYDRYTFHNLGEAGLGIDSAREVALEKVKQGLKTIVERKLLFIREPPALLCEYIESELFSLSRLARTYPLVIPAEFNNLSILESIDKVIDVVSRYLGSNGFSLSKDMLIQPEFKLIYLYLQQIKKSGLHIEDYCLPGPDLKDSKCEDQQKFAWWRWSDDQLLARIAKFYDLFQQSYRWIIDTYFPTLKEYLYFYRIGPVKYHAIVRVNNIKKDSSYVDLSWEPVAEGADTTTLIEVTEKKEEHSLESHKKEFDQLRFQLKALGRKSHNFSTGGGFMIGEYMNINDLLRKQVYKQLSDDFNALLKKI